MAKNERILILDIGSTAVHIGEFDYGQGGSMVLTGFNHVEYTENITEANRSIVIGAALRRALDEGNYHTKKASICVSGQAAFMRFVKLPPVTEEESRVRQIVEYEARQNVPFPMEEVIWDYQLIGSDEEELEVMFAVIKNDIVEGVIRAVTDLDLQPNLVDFAPAALYNAARANYIGEDECAMLLDIGGRCTNLLFLDGERFFARAIPIAGFTITQQIAKEFGISTDEAEILKRRHGFVALGGAYEEPESEVAATISKIIRNVMTRLHGEINRSINVYRAQQKGNKPTHLYLSGGSSTMAFTDHFFSEKLRMEVSYFNPFKIINLDESLDVEQLQEVAHMFPEVVGVALRNAVQCPVEISLITEGIKKDQVFSQRRPFIIFSCITWLFILGILVMVSKVKSDMYAEAYEYKSGLVQLMSGLYKKIDTQEKATEDILEEYQTIDQLLARRTVWSDLFNSVQSAKPIDVWVEYIRPIDKPISDPSETPAAQEEDMDMIFAPSETTTTTESKSSEFVWFDIKCHSVFLPEAEFVQGMERYSRFLFMPEQFGTIRAAFEEAIASSEEEDGGDFMAAEEEADGNSFPELTMAIRNNNRVVTNSNLPYLFVEALRLDPRFVSDPVVTKVVSFTQHPTFTNVSSFQVQLKLAEPISMQMP